MSARAKKIIPVGFFGVGWRVLDDVGIGLLSVHSILVSVLFVIGVV